MPLKIVRAQDPITISRLKMVIYGQPGVSKSSVAFTAEAPLLLDFDGGAHRAPNRKDIVQIGQWSEAAAITAEDLAPYKTVIIDTAGRALDQLTTDIIAGNAKMGNGGALSIQGYGVLKSRFGAFLNLLNSFGKDVILVAHMEEKQRGDDVIERLDVQGGSKNEIYKSADAMGRLVIENGQRWLKFSPTDAAFGKNPGQLEPLLVPHFTKPEFATFLASVIQTTKDRLNELTEDQRKAVAEQDEFRGDVATVTDAAGINGLISRAKAGGPVMIQTLHRKALDMGLIPDKASGTYIVKAEEPKADAATTEPGAAEQPKAA